MFPGKQHIALAILLAASLSCCTCLSKNDKSQNVKEKALHPMPEIPLPPNSADIQAWMQDYREEDNSFVCKLKIRQVDAYGPATPPLPEGYVLTLEVPRTLLEKNSYKADKIFVKGKLLALRVRHQGTIPGNASAVRWVAQGFSNLTQ